MTNDDISVSFCGLRFSNPLILPSGIAQEIPKDHERAIRAGAGGITTKSLTIEPREGNPLPRVIKYEHGYLNSVGLRGPGLKKGKNMIQTLIQLSPVPIIVSVFATSVNDFKRLIEELAPLCPALFELNLSCPNVEGDMGKPLGLSTQSSAAVVSAAKTIAPDVPLLAKLTPNVPNISEVAKACEAAGADGIVAINTVGPGMVIDIKTKKPKLGAKRGGISGGAIRPIAVRCVYDIYEAVKIPIIGMGGVETWQDVVEMMMAGASLVGVGSATYLKGYGVFEELKRQLITYMKQDKLKELTKIVGAAHQI